MKDRQQQKVADADSAIDNYLQALLKDVDEYVPSEPEVAVETQQSVDQPPVAAVVDSEIDQEACANKEGEIIPPWAEAPFQCLMFKLNGITLGIPLGCLQTIVEWDQEPSVVPGQPKWHLGIMLNRGMKVGIVDTAKIVMPERLSARVHGERQTGGFILIVGDGRWGLACDSIASTEVFSKDMVRWRTGKGTRPWLAGTAKDQLCAILDIDAFLGMITA
ncbi:MAG: chemotaxis protein CheW [Candidatus Polarisedimenticolaceae bacterium]|nr:chemotaxis protein CheW [Candidatus Polarisedimenticolaceae bacterium]